MGHIVLTLASALVRLFLRLEPVGKGTATGVNPWQETSFQKFGVVNPLEVSDMNVHMMPGVGAAVNMAAAVAVNMDVENNLAMNTLDGECACLEEEVCLHDSVAILMGDIESIVTDSDDLNSDREELEALISDLRSVLTEE